MFFRRIMFSAVMIGMLTGILLSAIQVIGVTPILLDAEVYEVAGEP
ncbi:MAG: CbtA family protein, partial [Moritella sp.]|nr:CbtA family protein [Moritella sp.]